MLFDPGEGTQRRMRPRRNERARRATGISSPTSTATTARRARRRAADRPGRGRTSRHGRLSRERHHLLAAAAARGGWFGDTEVIAERPIAGDEGHDRDHAVAGMSAQRLSHRVEAYGYRIEEPDGLTMLPERLAAYGVARAARRHAPARRAGDRAGRTYGHAGRVQHAARGAEGGLHHGHPPMRRRSPPLAEGVDLLVIESTFLGRGTRGWPRTTATSPPPRPGGSRPRAGVRHLVLTHFSERYPAEDERRFTEKARRGLRRRHRPGERPRPRPDALPRSPGRCRGARVIAALPGRRNLRSPEFRRRPGSGR